MFFLCVFFYLGDLKQHFNGSISLHNGTMESPLAPPCSRLCTWLCNSQHCMINHLQQILCMQICNAQQLLPKEMEQATFLLKLFPVQLLCLHFTFLLAIACCAAALR